MAAPAGPAQAPPATQPQNYRRLKCLPHPEIWTGQISVLQRPGKSPTRNRLRRFGQARFLSYRRPGNLLHATQPPSVPGTDALFGVSCDGIAASQPYTSSCVTARMIHACPTAADGPLAVAVQYSRVLRTRSLRPPRHSAQLCLRALRARWKFRSGETSGPDALILHSVRPATAASRRPRYAHS